MFSLILTRIGLSQFVDPVRNVEIDDLFDEADEGAVSTLSAICCYIDEVNRWEFHMSGFGDEAWPVFVRPDLDIVLQQVPKLLKWLGTETTQGVEIDLYEQGLERTLTFYHASGHRIIIECSNGPDWIPSPRAIDMDCDDLKAMLHGLIILFKKAALACAPSYLVEREAYRTWLPFVA